MDKATKKKIEGFSDTLTFLKKGYSLKKLPDGKVWVMENLKEPIGGAVWNEEFNCFMYTWKQAIEIVPQGFHLPSREEFVILCNALGYGKVNDEIVVNRLIKNGSFVLSGYAAADNGSLNNQGSFGCWWSSTWSSTKRAGYLSFHLSRVNLQENCNKRVGCAVRLIKN